MDSRLSGNDGTTGEGWIPAVVYPHEDGGGNDETKGEARRMDANAVKKLSIIEKDSRSLVEYSVYNEG